jgi:peptide chain release factor
MIWLQVTAGQGPAECEWAMAEVTKRLIAEAAAAHLEANIIESTERSTLLSLSGDGAAPFAESWQGTIQWMARSPFRPTHKRKNWFVGVELFTPVEPTQFRPAELQWETMRASGPGGQHVNRTESAVRVTHVPTGTQASATEERSQFRNRALALARLMQKLNAAQGEREAAVRRDRWRQHQSLERGNAVRTLRP